MTRDELEHQLLDTVKKLNEAADRVAQTSGYTRETKKIRLLIELIKEQLRNENSLPSTRQSR